MKRKMFGLAFCALLLSSCATIISGSKQSVKFTSDPSSATVYIDQIEVGKTPFETRLERKKEYRVMIKLEGYRPYETLITKEFNAWYLGNLLVGGIVGLVIDPVTGAIFRLTPKEINAQLKSGTAFKRNKDGIYVAVSLEVDPNWQKVAQLDKVK